MDVSGAVQWWEQWQLRILVLGSLVIQYFLLVASVARKFPMRSWFRPVIWIAYLSSDAIAIYALATLFNRHKKPHDDSNSNSILEVLWAPVLLIHLGGQDGITAYNIEDNELWTRHILTTVSQVTVAIYVFWRSRPVGGGDRRLLQAAILLFIPGILKCFEKPWAINRASINSLVSSDGQPVRRSMGTQKLKIDPLEDFIDKAISPAEATGYLLTPTGRPVDHFTPKLFVDLASPSPDDRIRMLHEFSALGDSQAYCRLQRWLSETFQLLYTKEKMFPGFVHVRVYALRVHAHARANTTGYTLLRRVVMYLPFAAQGSTIIFGLLLRGFATYLPFAAVALFHHSHREAYSEDDVKVTYALLCCTAVLELIAIFLANIITRDIESPEPMAAKPVYDDTVSQYSLIGLLVRNRKHSKMMSIAGVLRCNDFLQQHWRMKSCSSSFAITKLVLKYVKGGWEHQIRDVSSYRKFNDNRGQSTLGREGCYQELAWSLEGAFDESVLLWHLATDFCYYDTGVPRSHHGSWCTKDSCPHVYACPAWCQGSDHHERAVRCREMSNYMMYLLFLNPEMLMAGTRGTFSQLPMKNCRASLSRETSNLPRKGSLRSAQWMMEEDVHKMVSKREALPVTLGVLPKCCRVCLKRRCGL